jgi:DNA-directed RNA polymerase subunit RPC12/RpoP
MPCQVCGGRIIKTSTGQKCMKPTCPGHKEQPADGSMANCCGVAMQYTGLTQLGEPLYKCMTCGRTQSL